MQNRHVLLRRSSLIALCSIVVGVCTETLGSEYELYQTAPAPFGLSTQLFGRDFQGASLETFDFGAGPVNTFNTNFILRSIGPDTEVEAVALSLTDDAGLFSVTLQSERGLHPTDPPPGPTSRGTRPVFEDSWDMQIEFYVDFRLGGRTGPIASPVFLPPEFEAEFTMFTMSNAVLDEPPEGAVIIPGVTSDFYVSDFGMIRIEQGTTDFETVMTYAHATVPEPSANGLLGCWVFIWLFGVRLGCQRYQGGSEV